MTPTDVILAACAVTYGFPQRPGFLGPLDVSLRRGELVGIIGPNGAGKTTLLRLLAGLALPHRGAVRLGGTGLSRMPARERARRLAYLPQKPPSTLAVTALEVVLMGRFPHRRHSLFESRQDLDVCTRAMELTGTGALADRPMETLSGGEAQRVHFAAALAQEPEVLLLDEPTAALDLYHQLAVFELLTRLTRERGLACAVVTHDLNLAGRYADRMVLLCDGIVAASGGAEEVLTDAVLAPVYDVRFQSYQPAPAERPWILPQRREPVAPTSREGT